MPTMPMSGHSEAITATMAEAARTEPTDRSMPPVRMTKVIPAASTMLIDACCMTIDRLFTVRNLPESSSKPMPSRMSTGSMPSAVNTTRSWCLRSSALALSSFAAGLTLSLLRWRAPRLLRRWNRP